MSYQEYVKLGLNHHLLYTEVASEPAEHERTLRTVLQDDRLEILDIWIPEIEPYRTNEIKALRQSGKEIYYNVGTRKGKESAHPASLDPAKKRYSIDFYKSELDRALACQAAKVITNSGPDNPDHRAQALDSLVEFYVEICRYVPENVLIMVEPTDWDVDKRKLIGSSLDAVALARRIHAAGCRNFASMVDMGHLPLMHETIEQAMSQTNGLIGHIHMGNCILKDRNHRLFGDKHVPWGIPGGEYDIDDVAELLAIGRKMGYFQSPARGSASIEMRPIPGQTPEESLDVYYQTFCRAWDMALQKK